MRKYWFLLVLVLLTLVSCSKEKEYVITGSFDLPEEIQTGDTLIARGPLDGVEVYLLDIVTHDVLDTAVIVNEAFKMKGKIHPDSAFFATILCQWGVGLLVVEPGNIYVQFTAEGVLPGGTPLNDGIVEMEAELQSMREQFYTTLQDMIEGSDQTDQLEMTALYHKEQQAMENLIDSVYQDNKENLIGVYAASLFFDQIDSVEEFEAELEKYSDFVKNSSLVRAYRTFINEQRIENDMPGGLEYDPSLFEMIE